MSNPQYYKIVKKENGKLYSCTSTHTLEYKIGKWTAPVIENSKIFIFKNRETARYFIKANNILKDLYIYKVGVKNPQYCSLLKPVFISISFLGENDIKEIWKMYNNKFPSCGYIGQILPWGTMFADKVKLIEKVR
jgi:hypothetical protein